MAKTSQRLLSWLVTAYLRRVPVQRGKWRLTKWAAPRFLCAPLQGGLQLRVSSLQDNLGLAYVKTGISSEDQEMTVFRRLVAPGMTVFDIGANIGLYTLYASAKCAPGGQVHAFEPTPQTFAWLVENIEFNGLENVHANQLALSNSPGLSSFWLSEDCDCNSFLPSAGQHIDVHTVTLDDYVESERIASVDLIKLDVEGAEPLVIRGGKRLFSSEQAPLLMIEINHGIFERMGSDSASLISMLRDLGYAYNRLCRHDTGHYENGIAHKQFHFQKFPCLSEILSTAD